MNRNIDYLKVMWKPVQNPRPESLVLRLSDSQKNLQLNIKRVNSNLIKHKKAGNDENKG